MIRQLNLAYGTISEPVDFPSANDCNPMVFNLMSHFQELFLCPPSGPWAISSAAGVMTLMHEFVRLLFIF